jgi:phosphoribosylamine-glycine ligase
MSSPITAFPAPASSLRILLLGAGGREHALAYKPGGKVENVEVKWGQQFDGLVAWAKENKVGRA